MAAFATTRAGRAVGRLLTRITALVLAAFLLVFTLNKFGPELSGLKQVVDIGGENNLPTWWNGLLLLAVAVAAFRASAQRGPGGRPLPLPQRRAWLVIAAAAGYLCLDEIVQLHERLNGPVRATGLDLPTYAWLVPGVVIALTGCVVLARAARRLPVFTRRRLGVALACYFLGAIVMEGVNGLFSGRWLDIELVFAAGTTVEEALEMSACILALTAIVDHLAGSGRRPVPVSLPAPRPAPRPPLRAVQGGGSTAMPAATAISR